MAPAEKPLRIDIPVRLTDLRVAFSIAALAFEGDLPASIFHLQLLTHDIADWHAKAQVIAVFHTHAGHVTLRDEAYQRGTHGGDRQPVQATARRADAVWCGSRV